VTPFLAIHKEKLAIEKKPLVSSEKGKKWGMGIELLKITEDTK
jgi:hypothetical protein